jgi:serine protease Do
MKDGEVRRGSIGYVGVERVSPELAQEAGAPNTNGALVSRMMRDSEVYDAGLRPGDVIVAFNGQPVNDPSHFNRLVLDARIGSTATVTVLREGRRMEFKLPIVSTSSRTRR